MKKTFDINRFWQVLKWTVLTEKKSILTAAAAFTAAFLAIQLFSCFTIFDITMGLGPVATEAGMTTCTVLLSFMGCYYANGILGNAQTTQQRTTALMLPASNLEKFTARIIYCCIIMLVLLYVAAIVATGLRMLLELIAGHDNITSAFSTLFNLSTIRVNSHMTVGAFFFIASSLWSTSLFVLGGVFFSKRPFVWTIVTLVAGSIALFTLLFYIGTLIGADNLKEFFRPIFEDMSMETFGLIVDIVLLAFTVLNVWLSYWLYKRLQVVQHKWFNV
jgi:hypothetical protein